MADKQISQLTEVSTPLTTDLYVCQQSSTAKKISLSAIKEFVLKIANLSSTASSVSNSDYFLVQPSSGNPKKVLASTMKNYFSSGGGGSGGGAFYAIYGTTTYNAVMNAFSAGNALWCNNGFQYAPLCEADTVTYQFTFADIVNQKYLTVTTNGWSQTSM